MKLGWYTLFETSQTKEQMLCFIFLISSKQQNKNAFLETEQCSLKTAFPALHAESSLAFTLEGSISMPHHTERTWKWMFSIGVTYFRILDPVSCYI